MLFEAEEKVYRLNLDAFRNVEYAMADYYSAQGYSAIHHDFYLFHESANTKYPENEATLRETIGIERLSSLRKIAKALYPVNAGPGQRPEQPDLFVCKPGGSYFFCEVKRKKTGDYLRAPQMIGISLIHSFLNVRTELATVIDLHEKEPESGRVYQWVWPAVQEVGFHKALVS